MKYFGTDGIRGTYGDIEISEPFFNALGKATADWISENGGGKIVAVAQIYAILIYSRNILVKQVYKKRRKRV